MVTQIVLKSCVQSVDASGSLSVINSVRLMFSSVLLSADDDDELYLKQVTYLITGR